MADFYTNYPAPQKPMTLGEMLNMASGVQSYQQAQQMNPLALQKAQQEVEQARQINPLALRQKQAETTLAEDTLQPKIQQQQTATERAQFEFESKKADKSREIISALAQSPAFRSGNRNEMIKELSDTHQELLRSKIPPQEALLAISALASKVMQDPKSAVPFLENYVRQSVSPESRLNLQTPQLVNQPGGPGLFTSGTGTIAPANIAGQQPPPPQMPPPSGAPQGQQQQPPMFPQGAPQPQGVTPMQMSLPYPVRKAGDIRPLAPSEAADQDNGQKYREGLTKEARNLTTYRRSTDEVTREAEKLAKEEWNQGAGFIGKMGRNFSTFLGTDQGIAYKNLSKALAGVQVNSMKALGLSTDADKTLNAAANGDYTYPPEVLLKIASQAHGNMANIELQTKGAQAFGKKYGDSNQQVFQDLWNANSKDTRVFEAIAIYESNIPKEEKIKKIDSLLSNMSPKEIDALTKSKNRLLKLSQTGEL